jgi:peptide/nickel transport system permease protein
MLAYSLRRLAIGIVILFFASTLVFFLVAASGNPLAALEANPHIPHYVIRQAMIKFHLNDTLWQRYWIWLSDAVRGNFGNSYNSVPVGPQIIQRFGVTLRMVVVSTILSIFLAISVGVIAALRHGKATDQAATAINFVFLAAPVFVVGLLLKEFVAVPIDEHFKRPIIPTLGDANPLDTGSFFHNIPDFAAHALLPSVTLILATYASWAVYQRSTLLDVLDSDYVRFARAKGISSRRVLIRHVLRNALIPVTTVIALDFAGVLGGAVIVEYVFGWAGLGEYFLAAVYNNDVNAVSAYLLLTASIIILFNLAADILYGFLDPRIRYS